MPSQVVVVHPVPDALMTDATRLFNHKVAQIIRAKVEFPYYLVWLLNTY